MAVKYKISFRKIFQVLFTLAASVCCVIAMISASDIESNKPLRDVQVHIISGKKYHFIEEADILDKAIHKRNIDITNTPAGKIDIKTMESVLEADPWVAHAQLYIDNNRVLQMVVTQRIPLARLFEQNGESCYMDNTLHTMPLAANFNFYTSVVTNVPVLGSDSMSWMVKQQIAAMVRSIQADTFWNAQISQVILDSGFTFELLPILGDQTIVFGDTSRSKEKFNNLYAFYKKVLNRIGWDKYEKLDLRFKGQVVASPSLPFKGPVDRANATMNWLDAFVSTEVRKDSLAAIAEGRGKDADISIVKDPPARDVKKDAKPELAKGKEEPKKEAKTIVLTSTSTKAKPEPAKVEPKKDVKPAAAAKDKAKAEPKKDSKPAVAAKDKLKAEPKKDSKAAVVAKDKAKADPKKDAKHAVAAKDKAKAEPKKVVPAAKANIKAEPKKDTKQAAKEKAKTADDKKEKAKPVAHADKKDVKATNKNDHAAKDAQHDEHKKDNKPKEKPKEKAVLKQSDLGKEKEN